VAEGNIAREHRAGKDGDDVAWERLGEHLAHEGPGALLDTLGADDGGRGGGQVGLDAEADAAHVLGGWHEHDEIGTGDGFGVVVGGADAGVEGDAGQEGRVLVLPVDRFDDLGFERPHRDFAAGGAGEGGHRRAEGAAADNCYAIHALLLLTGRISITA
jgi:hypothetical protein